MHAFITDTYSIVQLYVPPEKTVNGDFLHQVLKGEKALLPISECKFVTMPNHEELAVRHIFPQFNGDGDMTKYMQDSYPKDCYPDRQH